MSGAHPYSAYVVDFTATSVPFASSKATNRQLQPVMPSADSDPYPGTGSLKTTPCSAIATKDPDRKVSCTREESRELFRRIEKLYDDERNSTGSFDQGSKEAKEELLRVTIETFGHTFDFNPYPPEGDGEEFFIRQHENAEELAERFERLCHTARMIVYFTEENNEDGTYHKAASKWQDELYGIEKSLIYPYYKYIKIMPRCSHSVSIPFLKLIL
jgi:hypothetical protein